MQYVNCKKRPEKKRLFNNIAWKISFSFLSYDVYTTNMYYYYYTKSTVPILHQNDRNTSYEIMCSKHIYFTRTMNTTFVPNSVT